MTINPEPMNHYEEQAAYEAAMNAQAQAYYEEYYKEREAFRQYLDSLIHQERFELLAIEIALDMIRHEYSEESGKTIVEFFNQERTKRIESNHPQTTNPKPIPWIKPKDQMPEDREPVLITDVEGMQIVAWYSASSDKWHSENHSWFTREIQCWMPIPEIV